MKKQILMVAVVALLVSGCGAQSEEDEVPTVNSATEEPEVAADDSSAEKAVAKEPTQTINVTMYKISEDYQDNALRAAELYTGKKLVITGLFDASRIAYDGNAVLDFRDSTSGHRVGSTVLNPEAKSAAINLNSGDLVQIECHEYNAEESISDPKLKKCGSIKKIADQSIKGDIQYEQMIQNELEQK